MTPSKKNVKFKFDRYARRGTALWIAAMIVAVLVVEFLAGFSVFSIARSSFLQTWEEQSGLLLSEKVTAFTEDLDGMTLAAERGDIAEFDGYATLGGNGLTMDGAAYPVDRPGGIKEKLLSGGVSFYSLSDITSASDSSEVCAWFSVVPEADDGSAELYIKKVSAILPETDARFARFGLLSESGRIIISDELFGGYLTDHGLDFDSVGTSNKWVKKTLGGNDYSVRAAAVGNTGYYFYSLGDVAEQTRALGEFTTGVLGVLSAFGALIIVIVVGCYLLVKRFGSSGLSRYRLTTDASGKIVKANTAFASDFPDTTILMENAAAFDPDQLNAVCVKDAGGDERVLACAAKTVGKNRVMLRGDILRGIATEDERDGMDDDGDCSTMFNEFREKDMRVLVGLIRATNIKNIETMFGTRFAGEVWATVERKARLKFSGVFVASSDTIGVLYPDLKDLDKFVYDIGEVMQLLDETVRLGDNLVSVGVRGGFAVVDAAMRDKDFSYALTAADGALRRAIEDNKLSYVYHESQKKLYAKYFRTFDIPQMLRDGSFYIEYQPQYNIRKGRISGFEALFRVKPTGEGAIGAYDVITYAERTGNMLPLGEFIFNTAMRFAKSIEDKDVTVSLNVSPIQLMQAGFVDHFLQIYDRYELRDGAICVEITESFLMTTFDETLKKLELLRKRGILVHLDDFGTKYSSFLYLKRLPISALKIDKEFVDDVTANEYSRAIVGMIVSLARELKLESIAEGVERMSQYNLLKTLGVDVIQGFLIGKSLSAQAAAGEIDTFALETGEHSKEDKK